jgi:hypothetical protein
MKASPVLNAQVATTNLFWRTVAGADGSESRSSLTCPSCHNKVVQFGHHLKETLLYPVPHRQYVFSIPTKRLPITGNITVR